MEPTNRVPEPIPGAINRARQYIFQEARSLHFHFTSFWTNEVQRYFVWVLVLGWAVHKYFYYSAMYTELQRTVAHCTLKSCTVLLKISNRLCYIISQDNTIFCNMTAQEQLLKCNDSHYANTFYSRLTSFDMIFCHAFLDWFLQLNISVYSWVTNKYRVLSSCDCDPYTNLREPTWIDPTSVDPLGVTHFGWLHSEWITLRDISGLLG